jgi:hypothetical protein
LSPCPPAPGLIIAGAVYDRAVVEIARDAARGRLSVGWLLRRPALLAALGVVLSVAVYQLWVTPTNPPGFHRDEASVAYNAYSLSRDLRDQDGGLLPLYIVSFEDYKSPLFVYLLAGVFRVADASTQVARQVAATVVLGAVLVVGLVAFRRTRSAAVAAAVIALAGLTPWLYEIGRVAFETAMEPLVIAVLLLALDWGYRSRRHAVVRAVPAGLALGALAYVYAAGRLLAPLYALALVVFAGRGRWRWLVGIWLTFAATMLPLAAYWRNHPGALTARYERTTFIEDGMSLSTIVRRALSHYVQDVNLWHWIVSGDPKPYIHASTAGQLLATLALLGLAGAALVLLRRRDDLWWRFVLVALVLSPIPAALTDDRHYALRLLPIPLLLAVLAIPALEALFAAARRGWIARAALAALAVGVAVQFVDFRRAYEQHGPARVELFEAGVPPLLYGAFEEGGSVYIDYDDRYAQTHALWYAVSNDLPRSRVVILPDGGIPPPGSLVFGRFQQCDYVCAELQRSFEYWIARAVGPKPT